MTYRPGDEFDGYELLEHLGSGGLATVWKAVHRPDGDLVALKFPNTSNHDRSTVRRAFERERETLDRLTRGVSPRSILRPIDEGRSSVPYLVVDYLDGPDLASVLDGAGPDLRREDREQVVRELCRTVEFIHRRGVTHLDIRPGNVLLREDRSPVVVDFNTARMDASPETVFEEGQYKPPEVLRDGQPRTEAGPWSDVYSVGAVARDLLAGPGDDEPDWIAEALRPKPSERPASMLAVLRTLTSVSASPGWLALGNEGTDSPGCPVLPGDTVGRAAATAADLLIDDAKRHISPEQCSVEAAGSAWRIRDTSLNGTYVGDPGCWTRILSTEGRRRLSDEEDIYFSDPPPTSVEPDIPVSVRPVDPEYGVELCLAALQVNRSSA